MTTSYPVPFASEEPLGSVTRVLALAEGDGVDVFVGRSLPQLSGRVYGGQVMAQGLLAAAATLPREAGAGDAASPAPGTGPHPADDLAVATPASGAGPHQGAPSGPGARPEAARAGALLPVREPHSLHAYFLRGGRLKEPIEFHVERLHDGRSFSQRRTTAVQDGEVLLAMISSYQLPQEGEDVQIPPPVVPAPEDLPSAIEIFRSVNHPAARFLGRTAAFDVRHVQGGIYLRPDAVRRDRQQLWLRARGKVPASATQTVHRALLTYVCDQVMLEPALRSRGLSWRTRGMSLATLDHAQWFHRDVDANDWLLVVQDSPTSQGGRAMGRARVYDRAGRLLSTIGQEGMVRVPGAGQDVGGRWQVRVDAQDPQDAQAG